MQITVVIPALNEEGNIGRLVEETFRLMPDRDLAAIIVVDDGSTDATCDEVNRLIGIHPKLRLIRHRERSGQSCAIRTGVLAAASPVIATMDGDGQNDPGDIMALAARLGPQPGEGPGLVGGVRRNRKAAGSKRLASKIANGIRGAMLKDNCPDSGCGLKVFWREAYVRLPFFTSMHRFMPALFMANGHEIAYVPVNDRPRIAGQSKYTNFNRALIGLYDLFGVMWLRKRTKIPEIVLDKAHAKLAISAAHDGSEPHTRQVRHAGP